MRPDQYYCNTLDVQDVHHLEESPHAHMFCLVELEVSVKNDLAGVTLNLQPYPNEMHACLFECK